MSRLTRVQFNCLKLVVSIDSWVAVLDFFGVAGDEPDAPPAPAPAPEHQGQPSEKRSGECFLCSLRVLLVCH